MRPELEKQILARWPDWFGGRKNKTIPLMGYGFQCGDGWFDLLVRTFERIEQDVADRNLEFAAHRWRFKVVEVKEKVGALCIIARGANERIVSAFLHARDLSLEVCEWCGAHGILRTEYRKTLCAICVLEMSHSTEEPEPSDDEFFKNSSEDESK